MKKSTLLCGFTLAFALGLSACGTTSETVSSSAAVQLQTNGSSSQTSSGGGSTQSANSLQGSAVVGAAPSGSTSNTQQSIPYTMYVVLDGDLREYTMEYTGIPNDLGLIPPEEIIAALADLSGWNLDLADSVMQGKGGMTVSFADSCSLFTGPPEKQKEDFFVYDAYGLTRSILDSIQKTFQNYYVDTAAGGDPNSLDIYFCDKNGGDIHLSNLDLTISSTSPYKGLPMQ